MSNVFIQAHMFDMHIKFKLGTTHFIESNPKFVVLGTFSSDPYIYRAWLVLIPSKTQYICSWQYLQTIVHNTHYKSLHDAHIHIYIYI